MRLRPDLRIARIYDLQPRFFLERGIALVLLDLDNTLAPYHEDTASADLVRWVLDMKVAGLTPYILSNNRGDRPRRFAQALGISYLGRAGKPGTRGLKQVLRELNLPPARAALIGDQIYTDVLCAKSAGVLAILVRPISLKNPLLALRYALEAPFRLLRRKGI